MTGSLASLPIVILSPHARCNCRCVMCDIWKRTDSDSISAEELARHLRDFEALKVEWVVFSGGEPLMHPDLFRLAHMLRERGIRVTLLSTGVLLSRNAANIVANIDEVIVSLDGPRPIHDAIRQIPGAFEKLAGGVRSLLEIASSFPISARCTVQKRNHASLRATAQAAHSLGIRSISFLAADVTSPEAFNRGADWRTADRANQIVLAPEEIPVLASQLLGLLSDWDGTGFVSERWPKLRRIVRHFEAHLGWTDPVAPRCNAPWVSTVIEADGSVRPCFFHAPIGSLATHSLVAIVNGFAAQHFRKTLDIASNPVCRRCVCSLHRNEVFVGAAS